VTRPLPLAILAILFMWLAANIDVVWMWVITGVALAALVGLIVAMRFKGMYVGPKTLVDDARLLGKRVARDRGGEADRIEASRVATELDRAQLEVGEADGDLDVSRDSSVAKGPSRNENNV